jgi:signal peptidase I
VDKLAYDLRVPFTLMRLATWADPRRGDIVVFFAPDDDERLIKRVVGLPGDVLEMRAGALSVNGRPLQYAPPDLAEVAALPESERAGHLFATERLDQVEHPVMLWRGNAPARSFGPLTVPDGHYFMMGDNRDNSRDSRYFGFVPRSAIVGRSNRIVASFDPDHFYLPRTDRLLKPLP